MSVELAFTSFPSSVQIDSEESKFEWQEILKLPFLPQHALTDGMASVLTALSAEEAARNSHAPALVITGTGVALVQTPQLPGVLFPPGDSSARLGT
jgi:5'-3' exonuclease